MELAMKKEELLKKIDNVKDQANDYKALDRSLIRNILDILTVCQFFTNNMVNLYVENIGMYSLVDGKQNPIFKMIVSVLGNVSEMERNNMLERQKQGIEIAKATKGTDRKQVMMFLIVIGIISIIGILAAGDYFK